jgi:hypothetical protein
MATSATTRLAALLEVLPAAPAEISLLDSRSSSATHTESDMWAPIWSPNDQLVTFKWILDTSTKIASAAYTRR